MDFPTWILADTASGPIHCVGTPMPQASVDTYLRDLLRLGILSAEEVDKLGAEQLAAGDDSDLAGLTRALLERGVLTGHQADLLRAGKADELVLGNYVILEKLGAGGMGAVFKARHRRMKRIVAIKVLRQVQGSGPLAFDRFQREVEAVAKLEHPNVVMAYDADESQIGPFLVMEFVAGSDLETLVKTSGPMAVCDAVDAVIQAGRGLAYAHSRGVVHRDIKPANLLRDAQNTVKVADLGLARFVGETAPTQDGGLTQAGAVFGTVDFMSPEQAFDSKEADHRSDIYSLGCTLYFLLAGTPVFSGSSMMAKLLAHRESPIPSLCQARRDVSEALDHLFQRMIAKRSLDRPESMDAVVRELESILGELKSGTKLPTVGIDAARASYLLVEPSRLQSKLIISLLRSLGSDRIRSTTEGQTALIAMNAFPPDVLISAYHLPDMTGLQLLAATRAEPMFRDVIFILVTSEHEPAATAILTADGRAASLPKPFGAEQLKQVLAKLAR